MRFAINLASEPFRRDRPMIVASYAVGALLLLLFCALVTLALVERGRASESRQAIARLEKQLLIFSSEQTKLESILRRPENAEVLERSLFVNSLLLRKGVSWTRIFSDLESVLPPDVRLITIRPQLSAQNELMLDMFVGSQSVPPVLQLLKRMEGSPLFGSTTVHNWLPPSQTEPLFRYRVSVNYAQKL